MNSNPSESFIEKNLQGIIIAVIIILACCVYFKYKKPPMKKIKKMGKVGKVDGMDLKDYVFETDIPDDMKIDLDSKWDEFEKEKRVYNNKMNGAIETTVKYHPDYKEILALIDGVFDRVRFNYTNLPAYGPVNLEKREVFQIVTKFVRMLGIKTACSYKIVDISNSYKWKTDKETKFVFDLVLQKELPLQSQSKIVLNVSLIQENWVDELRFFKGEIFDQETRMEYMTVVGYVNPDNVFVQEYGSAYDRKELASYESLEGDMIMGQECIDRILKAKKKEYINEMEGRNTFYDENGKSYFNRDIIEKGFDPRRVDPSQAGVKFGTEMVATEAS